MHSTNFPGPTQSARAAARWAVIAAAYAAVAIVASRITIHLAYSLAPNQLGVAIGGLLVAAAVIASSRVVVRMLRHRAPLPLPAAIIAAIVGLVVGGSSLAVALTAASMPVPLALVGWLVMSLGVSSLLWPLSRPEPPHA